MSQSELLTLVVRTLARLNIPYMVTGSLASSLYGEPRATHDVDLVVNLQQRDIDPLIHAFPPPRFYLAETAVREATVQGGMFNLLDMDSGIKVDFWMLAGEAFDQVRFQRRRTERIEGTDIVFTAPEDIILSKLHWAKLSGGSEKQLTDALRVYELQFGVLDQAYLNQWVDRLDVGEIWQQLVQRARPLDTDS